MQNSSTNYRVGRPASRNSGSLIFSSNAKVTTFSTLNGVSADIWLTYCMSFFGSKVFTRELTKLWTFAALISWNNDSIAHSQYITILTRLNRLRGFLVILPNLVWSSLCSSLFWELRGSRVVINLQFWPQSLGVIRIVHERHAPSWAERETGLVLFRIAVWDCFSLRSSSCFRFILAKQRNHTRHARGVVLGILCEGVLPGSLHPDPISDQKVSFSVKSTCFQTWPR